MKETYNSSKQRKLLQIQQLDQARSNLRRRIHIITTEEDTRRQKVQAELIRLQTKILSAQKFLEELENRQAHLTDLSVTTQRRAKEMSSDKTDRAKLSLSIRSYPVEISDTEDE